MALLRKIYTFADTPHLLKLLRNHIVDEGLRLPSGTVINKDVFLKLLAADSGEFRLAHKLELKPVQLAKTTAAKKVLQWQEFCRVKGHRRGTIVIWCGDNDAYSDGGLRKEDVTRTLAACGDEEILLICPTPRLRGHSAVHGAVLPDTVDLLVLAEIPDPITDSELHPGVTSKMVHGPCGAHRPAAPCMGDGACTKRVPKQLTAVTEVNDTGYPHYRRRSPLDGGRTVHPTDRPGGEPAVVDEIATFQQGRYLSAMEVAWRLLQYPVHEHLPTVEALPVHLSGQDRLGQRILIWSDNMGVVGSIARGWSANPRTMALIRHLLFAAARRGFTLDVRHVPANEPTAVIIRQYINSSLGWFGV
ncbi:hypothetical protein FJT64_018853 [Amphibalanus amphitrite]|uniref:Transposable element P transposase n=1 Tax=Amphibalanus amphitrite TaxID=1232801 RepID=A0A6A4X247_AMPAM|nr:hypothetical protein FJT64_018853 [Amphibalanus amphitrite]